MKTFTIYWRTGKRQVMQGVSIEDAFRKAGYGGGAYRAIDFYANGDDPNYDWNPDTKEWDRNNNKFNRILEKLRTNNWREECPEENSWHFTKGGKHSYSYATVDWLSHRISFERRNK